MRKTPEEESKKKDLHLYLKSHSGAVLIGSACAYQPPGFSVSGTSTPNRLFQTMNELKRLVSYSKQHLNNLELFVNY